eukprot:COSAG03_NODE_24320_length_273_cov_0.597701_1_plen_66_part_10
MSETAAQVLLTQYDKDADGELNEVELLALISTGRAHQREYCSGASNEKAADESTGDAGDSIAGLDV